jgi:hypothetical protein
MVNLGRESVNPQLLVRAGVLGDVPQAPSMHDPGTSMSASTTGDRLTDAASSGRHF